MMNVVRVPTAAAALLLLLAGCAEPSTDLEFGEPTPGPTAAQMLDVECAELLPERVMDVSFGAPLTEIDPVARDLGRWGIPVAAAVEAAGGLACAWADGSGTDVDLFALPDARDEFEEWSALWGIGDSGEFCDDLERPGWCGTSAVSRGVWVEAGVTGVIGLEAAVSGTNIMAGSTELTRVAGPGWAAPDVAPGRPDCTALTTAEALGAALGVAVDWYRDEGGVSFRSAARDRAGATSCTISDRDETVASVGVLPSGAWLWARARTAAPAEPLDIPGAAAAEARCEDAFGCSLDLDFGGSWVRVDVPAGPSAREVAIVVATAIAG